MAFIKDYKTDPVKGRIGRIGAGCVLRARVRSTRIASLGKSRAQSSAGLRWEECGLKDILLDVLRCPKCAGTLSLD